MKKWMLIFVLNLISCSTHQPVNGTAIDDMTVALHQGLAQNQTLRDHHQQNQRDMSNALMPDLKFRHPVRVDPRHRRFDIAVKDAPARAFYMGLVTNTPISLVVSPEIKGNVTLSLKHVTIEQVLQALEDTYNYTYIPIPGGYEVLPNTMRTQIYPVNYLELQRNGNSEMRLHSGEVTDVVGVQGQSSNVGNQVNTGTPGSQAVTGAAGSVPGTSGITSNGVQGANSALMQGGIGRVRTDSSIDFWKELQYTLSDMVGKENGRSVTVNPLAGVVVVRAFPKELKQVESYLDLVQNSVNRQVILEVKVLEVTLNNKYQMGIDWQAYGAQFNAIRDFPGTGISLSNFPDAFTARIRWTGDFVTIIQLLETQGNVQVLSSPRVSTMNNQQSMIKVGDDEFFVSGISPAQATFGVAAQATQQITPFFSGITLDVTPQIDVNGDVTLHVHPSVSLVTEQTKLINSGNGPQPTPLAHSTIRESDTVVHAKNGQVVIIGGLMQNQTNEDIAQLPFFGNVPFLGTLFRATQQSSKKSELVILIKPTVINKTTVNRDITESMQRMRGLKQGFHIGSRPDIFGTEGEEPIKLGPKAGSYEMQPVPRCRKGMRCVIGVAKPQPVMKE